MLDLFDVEDADYIWRYLWLVPAGFSAIALWMRFGTPEPEYISTAKPANFMMLMLLFITKLGTYLIIAKIILVQRQRNELSIVNRQYELHERAYRIYREHSDAERRLRHDFRHELAVLSVLAEKNELGELRDYIAKMVRTVPPSTRYRLASNPELDALLQYYAYEAERAGVRFTSRIETPVDHFAKSVDLTVVLGNLLENAVRHSGSQSGILLNLFRQDEWAVVEVRDHGIGLSPDIMQAVQSGRPLPRDLSGDSTRGMGIGLSVCQSIIKAHNGFFAAGNDPEGGAVIRFGLPMKEPDHE